MVIWQVNNYCTNTFHFAFLLKQMSQHCGSSLYKVYRSQIIQIILVIFQKKCIYIHSCIQHYNSANSYDQCLAFRYKPALVQNLTILYDGKLNFFNTSSKALYYHLCTLEWYFITVYLYLFQHCNQQVSSYYKLIILISPTTEKKPLSWY